MCSPTRSATPATGTRCSRRPAPRSGASPALFTEHWPSSADLWMPDGDVPEAGTIVRNPAYAAVLESLVAAGHAIRDDGPVGREARIDAARREWKTGAVARAAAAFLATPHRHSDGADHAGVITAEDFAGVRGGVRARRLDRVPRAHDREGRRMDAGPRAAADAAHPRRLRRHRPVDRSGRAHRARGAQARARRPRRVLRRRRRAARACCSRRSTRSPAARRSATRRRASGDRARCPDASRSARRCARDAVPTRATASASRPCAPDPRRHVPHRRRGPLGQHDRRHALGRLAAVLADDPRARLLPRHPTADDVARCRLPRGAARRARARARR